MNYNYLLFFYSTLFACVFAYSDYQQTIQDSARLWKQQYQSILDNQQDATFIQNIILLSYHIAQNSCIMLLLKLELFQELFAIHTPSLVDSWQTNMKVLDNDITKVHQKLKELELIQERFRTLYAHFKSCTPQLLKLDPHPMQTIIVDLKKSLLAWGKQQQHLKKTMQLFQSDLYQASDSLDNFQTVFNNMLHHHKFENEHLKEAAEYISKTYMNIETVFEQFVHIKAVNVVELQQFVTFFFKTYFQSIDTKQSNDETLFDLAWCYTLPKNI